MWGSVVVIDIKTVSVVIHIDTVKSVVFDSLILT